MSELNGGSTKLYSDLPPRIYSSATIPYHMNAYLSSLFGLDGKVAMLTGAGGHMGSMSVDCRTRMEIEATQEAVRFVSG